MDLLVKTNENRTGLQKHGKVDSKMDAELEITYLLHCVKVEIRQ